MTRLSFNVLGQFLNPTQNREFLAWIAAYRPAWVVIMDNHQLALDTRTATLGETNVVFRRWRTDDAYCWRTMTPAEFVVTLQDVSKDLWLYILNEPDTRGKDLPVLLDWLVAVGELLEQQGRHAILGNIGPATIEPSTIDSGIFRRYLEALAHWSQTGQHYAGWHEYTGILLPFGVGEWPQSYLEDPVFVQPSDWPYLSLEAARAAFALQKARMENPDPLMDYRDRVNAQRDYPPYWHLLRSYWFNFWAEEMGMGTHKIVLTEFGWDRMPDLTQGDHHIYQRLEAKWGVPNGFTEIRGPLSLAKIWKAYYPDWTFAQAAYEQLAWADREYPDNYLGLCLFTWCFDHRYTNKELR